MTSLFVPGKFTSNAGLELPFKIECDALSQEEIDALVDALVPCLGYSFWSVTGVPRGGLRIADSFDRYKDASGTHLLIVDDVLTTGGSMNRLRRQFESTNTMGAVLFARGVCPSWITPLFTMVTRKWGMI